MPIGLQQPQSLAQISGASHRRGSIAWREPVELALVRALLALIKAAGPAAASNIIGSLFRLVGPTLPVNKVGDANLRRALPELDEPARRRVLRGMWESLGRTAGEFPHLAKLRKNTPAGPGWTVENEEILREQAARGGPAIFVSGHIGNWEMLPPAVAAYGIAFSSVYRPAANQGVNDLILALRTHAMGSNIPMFSKGAQGARQALAHLRGGNYLGMLVDQKMNDGIQARLFGLPAMTAPAAAALALRFRCPIIPGYIVRKGPARLHLVVETPLEFPDTGDRAADIQNLTQMINDRLEAWVRAQPQSWLWVHRRFPKNLA